MKTGDLYDAYAAMGQLPVDARADEAAAAQRRSDALTRLDERTSHAKQVAEAAKSRLQADLRSEAQAASSRGAIPRSGTPASGSQPNFSRVRALRQELEGLLADKTRASMELNQLQSDLQTLERQIDDELRNTKLRARAKKADIVTYCICGVGVLLSIICGPALPGVAILVVALAIVGYRFRGLSAMMMRGTQKRPALGSHRKTRLGYILRACGCIGLFSLVLNLGVTAVLNAAGTNLALGELTRQDLDLYWFLGVLGTLAALVAGHWTQRGSS